MIAISGSFLLLLASACVGRHVDVVANNNVGIYGGTPINITDVPFMAAILFKGRLVCGATIVHELFLVTLAACGELVAGSVTVGTDNVTKGGIDYAVENVFLHPKYKKHYLDYDIAVVKLKKKLALNDRVNIIKMANSSMIPKDGDMLQTTGFGVSKNPKWSNLLLSLMLPYVDRKKCQQIYGGLVTNRMVCAGGEAGKGPCMGDAGGPLIYKGHLLGLADFGKGCGTKNFPAVFADVASMRDFVDKTIKNNS